MASLQARTTKGIKYYSIVESHRDDLGKPRNRIIQYLGTVDNILEKLSNAQTVKSYSHGLVYELIKVAREIGLVESINNHVSHKSTKNGVTVGGSFLLAALSRVSGDYSKMGWQNWNKKVSLEAILKKDFSKLDSDHFWQHMNCLTDQEIEGVQNELFKKFVLFHKCQPSTLLLDATIFFTYIDSGNQRCDIAKRGRNKQKRNDLRQVSTVLIVTKNELLPVYHSTYAGNINDVTMFKQRVEDIIDKVKEIFPETSLELVFDKGNLSKENLEILDKSEYKYTTSISRTWVRSIIQKHSERISRGEVVDCKESHWERERRFVVYRSKKLLQGQLKELRSNITKMREFIRNTNSQLEKRKSRNDKVSEEIQKYKYMRDVLNIEIDDENQISSTVNIKAARRIIRLQFGIIVLTTNTGAKTQEVITSYQSQFGVESVFRIMKNSVPFRPFYHWTDGKIKAHVLICLIAYILITSLHLKTKKLGFSYSIHELIQKLESIRLALTNTKQADKFNYQIEHIQDPMLKELASKLNTHKVHFRQKITALSVYN